MRISELNGYENRPVFASNEIIVAEVTLSRHGDFNINLEKIK